MAREHDQGIIILGVPRSGTTLLRRLLNWHPDVYCGGETFLLTAAARFLRADRIVDGIDYGVLGGLNAAGISSANVVDQMRELVQANMRELASRAGKRRWASKTAIDSFYVPEIELLFGGKAKFICLFRHGLDVALSLKDLCDANETFIRELHHYIIRFPRLLEAFAHAWADVTNSLLDFADRWPDCALKLTYEGLVLDPERTLSQVLAFLDLPAHTSLEKALLNDSPAGLGDWKTYSKTTIDHESLERWRELSPGQLSIVAPIVNPLLHRLDYQIVETGKPPSPETAMRRYELAMRLQLARSRAEKE